MLPEELGINMATQNQKQSGVDTTVPEATGIKSNQQNVNAYETANLDGRNSHRPYTTIAANFQPTSSTIVLRKGTQIPILDKIGTSYFGIFKNFCLTGFNEPRAESFNLVKTFGREWVAFFFGENPRIYEYNGHFLDYYNYPHYEEFVRAYDEYLRGTKCIENGMTMSLSYNGRIVRGYIIGMTTGKVSGTGIPDGMLSFGFSMLILKDGWVNRSPGKRLSNIERINAAGESVSLQTHIQDAGINQRVNDDGIRSA